MNPKTIKLLLFLFLLLLAAASYPWWKTYLPQQNKLQTDSEINLFDFTESNVEKILIKSTSSQLTISRDGSLWKANDVEATQSAITHFFDSLKETTILSLTSKNPENQSQYEITEDTGTLLTLTQNSIDNSFIVGKSGIEVNTFYIRKKDSNNVYLAESALSSLLTQSLSSWQISTESANPVPTASP